VGELFARHEKWRVLLLAESRLAKPYP